MKRAEFYLEKVIIDGKECIKVLGWKNVLTLSEILKFPEYAKGYPRFYRLSYSNGEKIVIHYKNYFRGRVGILTRTLIRGSWFQKDNWDGIEKIMKQAGQRFSTILKKEKWHGRLKIEI